MTQQIATMASLPLTDGCRAVFEAIDSATGDAVSGVMITNPTIYGVDLTGSPDTGAGLLTPVTPLWLPEPLRSEEGG